MPTIYQDAVRQAVHYGMGEHPDFGAALAATLERMKSGAYPKFLVDAIVQRPECRHDIYDAYSVATVDILIRQGNVGATVIPIARGPHRDSATEANNAILSTLPLPFKATFCGGHGDSDGTFEWDSPVPFCQWTGLESDEVNDVEVPPFILPLEVGATNYGRTFFHLLQEGGVARWAYGSDRVVVFRVLRRWDDENPMLASASQGIALAGTESGTDTL